jgi:bacillithiol biosynthesis cysteine-adding enzyme BshC
MSTTKIPYSKTGYFSNTMCDYFERSPSLKPFYGRFPSIVSIKQQLNEKQSSFTQVARNTLVTQLQEQYTGVAISETTQKNITALAKNNTFTVTTGHQLNLFSGPVFYVYKILSVINLTEELALASPEHTFVPIFWMATEDHDFEEINSFNFKDKKIQWDGPQGGPVGRISSQSIQEVVSVLEKEFGQTIEGIYLLELFKKAYTQHNNLTQATRFITNELFGSYGIVVLDGDDRVLKQQFVPYVKQELFNQMGFQEITKTSQKLVAAGYPEQVHPREINLFYIKDGLRERIIEKEGQFFVNNTEIVFTETTIKEILEHHPERFSPNALLRPLYQEVILPNLCYVGGGGELAYWFQLKNYFNAVSVPFPILLLRNSAVLVPQKVEEKLKQLDVSLEDIFKNEHDLSLWFTDKISEITIDFSQQRVFLKEQFKALYIQANQTDASFLGAVSAQEKKQLNGLNNLEKRLLRAQKRKHTNQIDRLIALRATIFPNGNLQERNANFSEFYLEYGASLIPRIKRELRPFDAYFTVISL